MTPRPLWKVSVTTLPQAEDAVAELLAAVFGQPASSYTDVDSGTTEVAAYLTSAQPALEQVQAGLARIRECGLDTGRATISLRKVRREDWAESWKRHFKPIAIGRALLLRPSWSRHRAGKGQAEVTLDPGLSFGTGQHPTTAFCLRQLVQHRPREGERRSLLDIGTGSGILAVAAAKLSYAPVEAFDFDPEAVRVAQANARKNRVSHKVQIARRDVRKMPLRSARRFSLVCANLTANLLLEERKRILARLEPGGVLVLAGILEREFQEVQRAYEAAGVWLAGSRREKEWRSGAFQANKDQGRNGQH